MKLIAQILPHAQRANWHIFFHAQRANCAILRNGQQIAFQMRVHNGMYASENYIYRGFA